MITITQVTRDPFARMELMRECTPERAKDGTTCKNCGSFGAKFRYVWVPDDRPEPIFKMEPYFCSRVCYEEHQT
jgi:hypothetical protein